MNNRIFKKVMCCLLSLSLFTVSAETVRAGEQEQNNNNITCTVDKEKETVTVQGTGVYDVHDNPPLSEEAGYPRFIHWMIGEGITRIKSLEHSATCRMESIQLPESLQIIDERAFYHCFCLKSIVIPQGVKSIGKTALQRCYRLTTITNHSDQTVYLPNYPSFEVNGWTDCLCYDYYVDGEAVVTVPPGKTAVGVARTYPVKLETSGGKLIDCDENSTIYFRCGEPLVLPKVRRNGYIFCGWTARMLSNISWFAITGDETNDINGSTYYWRGPTTLYAQYAIVRMKKTGKRKLNIKLRDWRNADKLEIQYSTNKKFKNAKSIIIKYSELIRVRKSGKKINKKKNYVINSFNRKEKIMSMTLKKLKAKKKYYFRFQFRDNYPGEFDDVNVVGDWFQESVKM